MNWVIRSIDSIAGIDHELHADQPQRALDRIAFVGLLLMVLSAPHSIASTQAFWLIGSMAWFVRLFFRPRPAVRITAVGIGLLTMFCWTAVSSFFSYEPATSIDKLRGVGVFLIFVYVLNVVRNKRAVYVLAFALIGSSMISAASAPIQKMIGRGVELSRLQADSPFYDSGLVEGDVVLKANGGKVNSPADVIASLDGRETVNLEVTRFDWQLRVELDRSDLLDSTNAEGRLGIISWKYGRGFRASGFYGHYATFAEVLQLIGALAVGLLIAAFVRGSGLHIVIALGACVATIALALLLSVTRGSQLAFIISSFSVIAMSASRKIVLGAAAIAIPVAVIGLYILKDQRGVGFFDLSDASIQYRIMMWRDGVRLIGEQPQHLVVGVGMDSVKDHWQEWGLFDKGWQPMGHFHSTPLQLAVERGIPALIIWLIVLGIYARTLWRGLKRHESGDWRTRGVLLGCAGGLIGFFVSGIVHYNLGDQEVAMVFYLLMGLGVGLSQMPSSEEVVDGDSLLLRQGA